MNTSLEDQYKKLEPLLYKWLDELERLVKNQLRKIEDPRLVRIRLTEARVKSLPSLVEKAKKRNWGSEDILTEAKDLIGLRIVCANNEDIRRIKELLVSNPRLDEVPHSEEDRTENPTPSGYRDFKFYIYYQTGDEDYPAVICEVQIRTMMQDSWARLAHKDIYKEGDDLPESLKRLSYRLSDLLHFADQIAQDIRNEISKKRAPSGAGDKIMTEDSLISAYERAFQKTPPDYLVRLVRNKCEDLNLTSIQLIEKVLHSSEIRKRLSTAYRASTHWDIDEDLVFEMSPLVAACGTKVGEDAVKKYAEREWEEIDSITRREMRAELPPSFDDFLASLEPHSKDDLCDFPGRIYRLAEALGVERECSICGAPIVDGYAFAESALAYYDVEGNLNDIESMVDNSGADTGEGSLCSYHAYHKND